MEHVRANENHEVEGPARGAQRRNCSKALIWPKLQKNFCRTWGSFYRRRLGRPGTLRRPGRPAKVSYRGRRASARAVNKNTNLTVAEFQSSVEKMEESITKSTISAAFNQLGIRGRIEASPLCKTYKSPEFAEMKHMKTIGNKNIWSDETKTKLFHVHFERYVWRKPHTAHHLPNTIPNSEIWLWKNRSSEVQQEQDHWLLLKKRWNTAKYRDFLEENLFQSAQDLRLGQRFTFQPEMLLKKTKECLQNNSVSVLDYPSHSPDLNPIEHHSQEESWQYSLKRVLLLNTEQRITVFLFVNLQTFLHFCSFFTQDFQFIFCK